MADQFKEALQLVLDLEGNHTFTNAPLDKGGPTYSGLTQKTYDGYCVHHNLPHRNVGSLSDGEVADVYQALFWNLPQDYRGQPIAPNLPYPADVVFFQLNVNCGIGRSTKLLQSAVLSIPNGSFGPDSLFNIPKDGIALADSILRAQLAYYAVVAADWNIHGLFNRYMKVRSWMVGTKSAKAAKGE